jgi:PAS domain S-box-containing protein
LPFITTAVTLLVVEAAARGEPVNTPVVVFVLPILLSAYTGGLVPGLPSTILSTLASVYFVLPPLHSWGVASPVDNIKWITLAAAGTLISFLVGRRERPGTEPLAQLSRQAGSVLLSTQRRVQAGFAVLLTCLVAMAAVSYPMLVRMRKDAAWVENTHQAIASLRLLISSATDAETSERGYLITGSAEYLEPYQSAVQNVNQALDEVRRLTSDNREQQRRLADLKPLVGERLAVLHRAIELRNQSSALARDFVLTRRGGELKDRIRGIVAEMEAAEQALLITREEAARRSTKLAKVEILGGSALAIVIVAAALLMIGQAFTASRRAETALEESRDRLEIRVNERTSELRTSEQRLRRFYESGLIGVIYWNMNGEITDANDKFLDIVGYNREDLKAGRVDWTNMTPLEYRHLDERSMEDLRATGVNKEPFEKEYIRKDGTRVPILIAGAMLDETRFNGAAFVLDITQRKQAEEALRESEERLRVAVEAAQLGTWDLDLVNDVTVRSLRHDQIWGYSEAQFNWSLKIAMQNVPPEDRQSIMEAYERGIKSGVLSHENRIIWPDGSIHWILANGCFQYDDNGRPIRVVGVVADTTERKRAEEDRTRLLGEVQKRAAELEATINSMAIGLIVYDSEGKAIRMNSAAERVLPAELFSSTTVQQRREVIRWEREDGKPFPLEEIPVARALRGETTYNSVIAAPSPDHKLWISASAAPIRMSDGRMLGAVASFVDITDRKRAEEALRESEAILQSFFDSPGVMRGMVELVGGQIVHISCNDTAAQIYGIKRDSIAGKTSTDTGASGELTRLWTTLYEEARSTGKPVSHEYLRADAQGRQKWHLTTVSHLSVGRSGNSRFAYTTVDLTDRKRAEELLRESEHRLAGIIGSAMDSVISVDERGKIVLFNPAAEKMFGCAAAEAVGQPLEIFIPERFRATHAGHIRSFGQSAKVHKPMSERGEISGLRTDGTEFPIEASISQAHVGQRKIFTVILRDISERKRAEEALAFIGSVVESSQDAIIGKSLGGTIQSWNRGAEKLYGYTAAEVAGQSVSLLSPPERQDEIATWLEQIRQGGSVEHQEAVRLHEDGRRIAVSVSISPVKDAQGRLIGASTIARDITERKRAEAAVAESERRFRQLFERSASALAVYDVAYDAQGNGSDFRYVDINPTFERVTRRVRSEVVGRSALEVTPEIKSDWFKLFGHVARTGEPVTFERYVQHLGMYFAGVAYSPGPNQVAVSFTDVTARKRAEETLAIKAEELARSNSDLAQFAYVASHDLKEPLRAVSGCVGLLKRHYEGKLDERASEFMAHIVDGAARMETLIDGLLAFSRVGTQGGELQPVECAKALGTALQNLAASIEESGALVTHDTLPAANGDLPQLVSLFQNLIGNALKFRQKAPPRIHVSAERNGRQWRFSVRDNGFGIAPQYFERIFGVFQRLHTRREYPGTGIGLAICKKIVERHGGRIWLESLPGEGATFYFSLPAAHL